MCVRHSTITADASKYWRWCNGKVAQGRSYSKIMHIQYVITYYCNKYAWAGNFKKSFRRLHRG